MLLDCFAAALLPAWLAGASPPPPVERKNLFLFNHSFFYLRQRQAPQIFVI
jgi:hypothetical protein